MDIFNLFKIFFLLLKAVWNPLHSGEAEWRRQRGPVGWPKRLLQSRFLMWMPGQRSREVTCCTPGLPASGASQPLYYSWVVSLVWGAWRHAMASRNLKEHPKICQRTINMWFWFLSSIINCWCCYCLCKSDQKLVREWWNGRAALVQSLWLPETY